MGPKKVRDKVEPKRSMVRMTIEQKKEIIKKHEDGARIIDLCREYKKSSSTICTIIGKKKDIVSANVAKGVKCVTKKRSQLLEDVEQLLLIWINQRYFVGDSISEAMIREKALKMHDDLVKKTPGTSDAQVNEFKASRGWFEKFKRRSGIHSIVRHGEAASSDKTAAEEFVVKFKELVESEEYLPEQVFNCDETGLFWKKMPKRTYITQEEKALPGHKPMKDRLTLLLCGNARGDLKIKPMLVYHSENPRVFKKYHVQKTKLHVMWKSNPKAWVTKTLFMDWMNEVFCPSVKKYLEEKSLPLRALLVLDNAPAHPHNLQHLLSKEFKFIKIIYLPPNTTPLIQPMDQQIISNFKKLYTKALFRRCFDVTSDTHLTLRDFWKNHFDIYNCLGLIDRAWEGVTQRTMNAGWRNLWPDCAPERDFEGFGPEPVVEDIVSLGRTLGLEVDGGDVEELVDGHTDQLTTEELVELKKVQDQQTTEELTSGEEEREEDVPASTIKKVCAMWDYVQSFCEENHPDKALTGRFLNNCNDHVIGYFRDLIKTRQIQTKINKYFVKRPSEPKPGPSGEPKPGPSGEPKPGPSGMHRKRRRESTPEMTSLPEVVMEGDYPSKR